MGAAPPPSASATVTVTASTVTASTDGADLVSALGAPSSWPPGFRFHPTDEELVLYYLKRKVCRRRIRLPMIGDVDVYKFEPWELPDRSVLRSGDKQWYFFSPRDRKYPNGSRSNRTTRCGYWKATGKDRIILQHSRPAGYKKTLVYHQGRAPKGQRTDWVMYEYTMDEELMSNFDNVQDYYALYKVFRKSGPGPKNGEQYGAPFREDKWDDESDDDVDCSVAVQEVRVEAVADGSGGLLCDGVGDGEDSRVESVGVHSRELAFDDTGILTAGDLEELLMQMTSEEMLVPLESQFPICDPKVGVESELGSHPMGPSYATSSITKQTDGGWCEQDSIGTTFDIPQSAPMYAQLTDTTEVTYFEDCYELDHAVAEQEFMEIKDINCPPVWGMDDIKHEDDTNVFYDPSDYFDPSMILAETMGSLDATATFSYLEGYNEDESLNSGITSGFWTHEQSFNVSAPMPPKELRVPSPTTGVVFSNNVSNLGGDTQGQIAGSESESWFNSTVAALLASVPSPPAIASENALITRAFERVASFKIGQITAQGQNSTAGGDAVVGGRQRGRNNGFIFISFLVGLGAIFWVLTIGVAVKIIKSIWSRFVTS